VQRVPPQAAEVPRAVDALLEPAQLAIERRRIPCRDGVAALAQDRVAATALAERELHGGAAIGARQLERRGVEEA
jgi:hypothetical protein